MEKTRTGPKLKKPMEKVQAVAFYATGLEIKEFGGLEEARTYAQKQFYERLQELRAAKAKHGK